MPIDNPIGAIEKQFEMEDLSVSPVTKAVFGIVSLLPPVWPISKAIEALKGHLAADSLNRIYLMLETLITEIQRHEGEMKQLRAARSVEESRAREEVSRELLLDAARKAESTRAKERVKRIGLILANAIVEPKPTDADEVEEMMRVATELSDNDIKYLRELVKIEADILKIQDHIPRYEAHTKWVQGFWGDRIIPEIDSVFSKLESYGLVARLAPPNNLNIIADFQNRYVLLKKGLRFDTLAREAAAR